VPKPTGRPRGRPPKSEPTPAPESGTDDTAGSASLSELPTAIEDVLPAPPASEAPDVQAAVASLTPPPEPPAPGPAFVDGGRLTGPDRPAPYTGKVETPVTPIDRWSDRRIRRSNRSELGRRVRELESELASVRPLGAEREGADATALPAVDPVTELEELFKIVLPGVSAILEYTIGPEMRVDATEQRVLIKTGAPAALPHFAKARAATPLLPFLVALAAVFVPKGVAVAKARQKRQAAGELPPAPELPPARPTGPVPAPEVPNEAAARDRFGGPRE